MDTTRMPEYEIIDSRLSNEIGKDFLLSGVFQHSVFYNLEHSSIGATLSLDKGQRKREKEMSTQIEEEYVESHNCSILYENRLAPWTKKEGVGKGGC